MTLCLEERVTDALKGVIDPETLQDVWHMKLIRNVKVTKDGEVFLTFRPSSAACPLGFTLGVKIKEAVRRVEGIRKVHVEVQGFMHAPRLEQLLEEMDR